MRNPSQQLHHNLSLQAWPSQRDGEFHTEFGPCSLWILPKLSPGLCSKASSPADASSMPDQCTQK
eukprot:1161330-Pelagomonas_calceolata.AAC.3